MTALHRKRHPQTASLPALRAALMSLGWSAAALGYLQPASAQYAYNPRSADEAGPGIRYFGSAKDEQGTFLPGVTVVLRAKSFTFVFLTDELGRFHGKLPVGMTPALVAASCSKGGFEFVRTSKRSTAALATEGVQVDCLLRASRSK